MKILVACEESQAVTIELRRLGHEAYSCDIIPCSGGHPEWHIMQNVLPLKLASMGKAIAEIKEFEGAPINRLRELAQADKADEIGKYRFYYCESEDEYLIGARLDTFYYARWDGSSFTWSMSRYLPWGKHVVAPETAWKEYTYPSEPKEIGMSEWFKGFLGKLTREAAEAALVEREAEHDR